MQFIPLLSKQLKDDEIMDLLEIDDVETIYDFDKSHENIPDVYWAHFKKRGFLLRFNEKQALDVIFIYIKPHEGFTAIDHAELEDVLLFANPSQVETYCVAQQFNLTKGGLTEDGQIISWVRIDLDDHTIHYEYRDGALRRVTLSTVRIG